MSGRILTGRPVVFAEPTVIESPFGAFAEVIEPFAFSELFQRNGHRGTILNRQHDDRWLLARSPGTMQLSIGPLGLDMRAELPPTQLGDETAALVERRDLDAMGTGSGSMGPDVPPPCRVHVRRDLARPGCGPGGSGARRRHRLLEKWHALVDLPGLHERGADVRSAMREALRDAKDTPARLRALWTMHLVGGMDVRTAIENLRNRSAGILV